MLFIDLEYSLPSSRGYREKFIEIIQYGMVLYDKEGKKILEDHSLVKPNKKSSLNLWKVIALLYKKHYNYVNKR